MQMGHDIDLLHSVNTISEQSPDYFNPFQCSSFYNRHTDPPFDFSQFFFLIYIIQE